MFRHYSATADISNHKAKNPELLNILYTFIKIQVKSMQFCLRLLTPIKRSLSQRPSQFRNTPKTSRILPNVQNKELEQIFEKEKTNGKHETYIFCFSIPFVPFLLGLLWTHYRQLILSGALDLWSDSAADLRCGRARCSDPCWLRFQGFWRGPRKGHFYDLNNYDF